MKKGVNRSFFNSQEGKVNILLLLSIVLIFVLTVFFTEAVTVTLRTPGSLTYNTSANRKINFTYTPVWSSNNENASNCSVWTNVTGTWAETVNNMTAKTPTLNNTLSWLNFTFINDGNITWSVACYNLSVIDASEVTGLTFSQNSTFFLDNQVPTFNFTMPILTNLNTTANITSAIVFQVNDSGVGVNLSANFSINLSIFLGGTRILLLNYINRSDVTNLTCGPVAVPISPAIFSCNASYNFNSGNGTYLINASSQDVLVQYSTGVAKITIDTLPPVFNYYNITDGNLTNVSNGASEGVQLGTGNGVQSSAQGRTIFAYVNWTDNLTQTLQGALQFFNATSGSWQTLNTSPSGYSAYNGAGWTNFSFPLPVSRGEFEGRNISFRIIANDTLGNLNNSNSVKNFTIQINDTLKPSIAITGTLATNGTNLTTNTVAVIGWTVNEPNALIEINISVDNSLSDPNGCNIFKRYNGTTAATNPNQHRNDTLNASSDEICNLANGSHSVIVKSRDSWGNVEVVFNNFTMQSGNLPIIFLNGTTSTTFPITNGTSVTSNTNLSFSALVGTTSVLKNMSFTSSCNSTGGLFNNNTGIRPFQGSSCAGTSGNQTVTVTAYDFAGNTVTTMFQFYVDNTAPSLAVALPTDGGTFTNNVSFNWSVKDNAINISFTGFYLDDNAVVNTANFTTTTTGVVLNILNFSVTGQGIPSTNFTDSRNFNFTAGTHKIKFTANDSLGNEVNSSVITFTVNAPVVFGNVNGGISVYLNGLYNDNTLPNITVSVSTNSGYVPLTTTNDTSGLTMRINFILNGTVNVSLTDINASNANWNATNIVVLMNQTTIMRNIQGNWTNTILPSGFIMFNGSIGQFVNNNNNSYYGTVMFPYIINLTNGSLSSVQQFWWFPNENDLTTKTNISQCTVAFTQASTTPCWNSTSGGRTLIQVPHMSIVLAVNDTNAPAINVTTPLTGTVDVSMFVPNITVSNDAVSCSYQFNATTPVNVTMTKSGNVCLGQTERLKNSVLDPRAYNLTFWVTDATGNIAQYLWYLNVSDTTAPNNGLITSSATSTTAAAVTITGTNESVNVTVNYGTSNTSLTSSATETDFNVTQIVSISSLTAGTTYYFNVTVCDFNGNCKTNASSLSFATSAAASSSSPSPSSSSSSGGGGGGVTTTATLEASTGKQWDKLDAGTTAVVTVNNENIGVTGIIVDVKNSVTSPSINVGKYTSNPLSTSAASKVYQYLSIEKSNIGDSDLSKVTINFRVEKSWLTSNAVADSDIVLWRYTSGNWNKLETKLVNSDGLYANYEAVTPGFSTFAIGNKESGTSAFAIIDMIRDFYAGTSTLSAFDVIDQIRTFYGG